MTEPILLESNQNHATFQTNGISTALPASMGMGGGYVPMITNTLPRRMDGSPQPDKGNGAPIVATVYGIDQQGGEEGEETAGAAGGGVDCASIGFTNRGYYTGDVTETLRSDPHGAYPCVGVDVYNQEVTGEVAASLTAASGGTNTSGPKVLAAGFSFGQSAKARSIGYEEEVSPTLRGGEGGNQKPCVVPPIEGNGARPSHQGPGFGEADDPSYTLNAVERHGVAECAAVDCRNGTEDPNTNGTLQAHPSGGGGSVNLNNVVRTWGGKRTLCADVKFFQTYEETSGALLATQYKDPPITMTTEETT